jgi:poly-gamma-glutamate synthesis protein (capsule biosynthesis protein)
VQTSRLIWALLFAVLTGSCATAGTEPPAATDEPPSIRIALGGDVMFGRWRDNAWESYENRAALEAAADVMRPAVLAVVNLESGICLSEARKPGDAIRLTTPPNRLASLVDAGIDVVSLANNHATDCGASALETAGRALESHGVRSIRGSGGVEIRAKEGVEVVAIGATFHPPRPPADYAGKAPWVVEGYDAAPVVERVRELRREHGDAVLLVSLHWGVEGAPEPGAWQVRAARELVEAGADIIYGHGSHTVQRVEQYRGAAIAYGLGNLHFDMRRGESIERAVAVVDCVVESRQRCTVDLKRLPEAS